MTQTTKFRGYSITQQKWIYGDLIHIGNRAFIVNLGFWGLSPDRHDEVYPESVGQWTGQLLGDVEIYNGDILIDPIEHDDDYYLVEYNQNKLQFVFSFYAEACHLDQSGDQVGSGYIRKYEEYEIDYVTDFKIIGSTFLNPELLK